MATPVEYRLGMLPERRMDWRAFASSYGVVAFAVLLVLSIGYLFPQKLQVARNYVVTEIIPRPDLEPKPIEEIKRPPIVKQRLLPPTPVEAPKLTVPKEVRMPKPVQPVIEPPKVAMNNFAPPVLKEVSGAKPVQIIHTGDFGGTPTPTVNAQVQKVQTGGFGDPNGLKGEGKQAKLVAANTGAFDLAQGAGSGNGTGGTKGIKGTVASAGFGNGVVQPGQGDGRANGRGIQTSGFGSTEVAQNKARTIDAAAATTTVEIVYKPNPAYTDEARQLQLQGEVLLEVSFGADGRLQVERVVRGLGHGLDEAAIVATNKIKFKPALRSGIAVDSTAVVHVVFQLAM